jgi:hypothetical protein
LCGLLLVALGVACRWAAEGWVPPPGLVVLRRATSAGKGTMAKDKG